MSLWAAGMAHITGLPLHHHGPWPQQLPQRILPLHLSSRTRYQLHIQRLTAGSHSWHPSAARSEPGDLAADSHSVRAPLPRAATLLEAVQQLAGVDAARAQELLLLGAVYHGEEIKGQGFVKWRRATAQRFSGDPSSHRLEAGELLRVHPHPKRFPACAATHWPSTLLHVDTDYVVLNKPAGVPCMSHESNALEHLQVAASAALCLGQLEVCHRLDTFTTGVLVLSRHKAANHAFKEALQDKAGSAVGKVYKALTALPAPLGAAVHYMYDGPFGAAVDVVRGRGLQPRGPRLLSVLLLPGWKECRLVVLSSRQVTLPSALQWVAANGLLASSSAAVHENTIQLVTGRTHQIRAQLAALGRPILGDVMYQPLGDGLLVGASGVLDEAESARVTAAPQLSGAVGLHAWRLAWGQYEWVAPAPWEAEAAEGPSETGCRNAAVTAADNGPAAAGTHHPGIHMVDDSGSAVATKA